MATIQEYISTYINERVKGCRSLVVYDQEQNYQDLVLKLANEECIVIDAANSTILGREQAVETWRDLATANEKCMIIYLPYKKPIRDIEKQQNPYQIFEIGGGSFPDSDGESYQALCHKAAPDQVGQIDQLFAVGMPDFETINNLIQGGNSWPKLRTLLKAESATEIVVSFLSPSDKIKSALNDDQTWVSEAKEFLHSILHLKLKTSGKKWKSISDEVWRYLLYSEFVFDLPVELPVELKDVPSAPESCTDIIYGICDILRGTDSYQEAYMDHARQTEEFFKLEKSVNEFENLGERDTFEFEERTFVKQFSDAILSENYNRASDILAARQNSIWVKQTIERQAIWTLANWSSQLIKQVRDITDSLNKVGDSLIEIFNFYIDRFRLIDKLHRDMERAISDTLGEFENLDQLIETARELYFQSAEVLQSKFIFGVTKEGWPVNSILRNNDVFDQFITPWLNDRKKTAFFMVDALRYELAAELEIKLSEKFESELHAVCAQLPTVTSVGMASLLPEVNGHIRLKCEKGQIVPFIKDAKVCVPQDRLNYVKSLYGERVEMIDLDKLVKQKK